MRATKTDPIKFQEQFRLLEIHSQNFPPAEIARMIRDPTRTDPLKILVSTIISSRTRDSCTRIATETLFSLAPDLWALARLEPNDIAMAIKPAGFPVQKAKQLFSLFRTLIKNFDSLVPQDFHLLLSLPGVGPKTASLVQAAAFGIPSICVDVHVLRIAGRLGWVSLKPWTTKTMYETRQELEKLFPQKTWNALNPVLVVHGQNCCLPTKPSCQLCPLGSESGQTEFKCPSNSPVDHP